jgi:hypothetical protein
LTALRDYFLELLSRPRDDPDERPASQWTGRGALGTAADLIAVSSALLSCYVAVRATGNVTATVLAVQLCFLSLVFLGMNFHLQRRFSRESRRATNAHMLADCNRQLMMALVAARRGADDTYAAAFQKAAAALQSYFSAASRHKCRVAVKDVLTTEGQELAVQTLCRGTEPEEGDREWALPRVDLVAENTDFNEIFAGARFFFSNDLTKVRGYRNSHFTSQMRPHEYPYRSVMVWPIQREDELIGFLCVDSPDKRAFDRRLDQPIGRSVAFAMYSALSQFREGREDKYAQGKASRSV